jgi:NADH-quinone oxidoreductase subunit H
MLAYLQSYLGGNAVTPGEAGNQLWALFYILVIFAGVSVVVMAMNWIERKALAHMQVRLGPMRVGPHGLLQPIADALKLLLKEDIIPERADKFVFWIAPLIGLLSAFTVYIVVPFGPTQTVTDMNIGILFMLGVSSLSVLGVVMAGWASNSNYPLMGALRSSAQMVSYEVAMGLAVVSAVLMTSVGGVGMYDVAGEGIGTLSMIGIVRAQEAQHVWFLFKFFPLGLIAFFIFAVAMIAETNRAPFDLPEAESELTAGFHTEYSGLRWSLFMLAEYAAMVAVSSIAVTLWLGGWLRPFPNALAGSTWDLIFALFPGLTFLALGAIGMLGFVRMPGHSFFRVQKLGLGGFAAVLALLGLLLLVIPLAAQGHQQDQIVRLAAGLSAVYWFVAKVAVFMYLYIWYRATFPRYRFDQLMSVGWKVLLPIALGVLIATALTGILLPAVQEWLKGRAG